MIRWHCCRHWESRERVEASADRMVKAVNSVVDGVGRQKEWTRVEMEICVMEEIVVVEQACMDMA